MNVVVRNLKYKNILKNINLNLSQKKFVSIIGPNGSGKSTFLKCLVGLIKNYQGEIYIQKRNLKNLSNKELSKLIAYVPQKFNGNSLTVFENILLGRLSYIDFKKPKKEDYEYVEKLAHELDLTHLLYKETKYLSGGELQKVQIARALAQNPKILVLDEPTNNLDIKNKIILFETLKKLSEKILVISIIHDLEYAYYYSDYFLLFKDGKIVKSCHKNFLSKEDIINLFELEFSPFSLECAQKAAKL